MTATIEELEKRIAEENKVESKLAHDLASLADVMEAFDQGSKERKSVGRDYAMTANGMFSARIAVINAKIEIAKLKNEPVDDLNRQLETAKWFLAQNEKKIVGKAWSSVKKMHGRLETGPNGEQFVVDKRGNKLGDAGEKLESTDLLRFGADGKLYKVKKE